MLQRKQVGLPAETDTCHPTLDLSSSSIDGGKLLTVAAAAGAALGEEQDGGGDMGRCWSGRGWDTIKLDQCSRLRGNDVSLFLQSLPPALTSGITSLSIQGLQGCGGRLPPHIELLTSLRSLDASSCGLVRTLDRQLLALSRLTDLVLTSNDITDVHTGGILKGQQPAHCRRSCYDSCSLLRNCHSACIMYLVAIRPRR